MKNSKEKKVPLFLIVLLSIAALYINFYQQFGNPNSSNITKEYLRNSLVVILIIPLIISVFNLMAQERMNDNKKKNSEQIGNSIIDLCKQVDEENNNDDFEKECNKSTCYMSLSIFLTLFILILFNALKSLNIIVDYVPMIIALIPIVTEIYNNKNGGKSWDIFYIQ